MKLFLLHRMLLVAWLMGIALSMFNKRSIPEDYDRAPPEKKFRHNAADLFLSNDVSAQRTVSLMADANAAGAKHVQDLIKGSKSNISRNLISRLKRKKKWPPLYYAQVRVFDKQTQATKQCWVGFLLPNEVIGQVATRADMNTLLCRDNMSAPAKKT